MGNGINLSFEEQLAIFKNVNSKNKKFENNHMNFISGHREADVIKNQGIAKAKLREYVVKEGVDFGYWKNL